MQAGIKLTGSQFIKLHLNDNPFSKISSEYETIQFSELFFLVLTLNVIDVFADSLQL